MGILDFLFGKGDSDAVIAEACARAVNKAARLKRSCWVPKVSEGDEGVGHSKFSGVAFIPQGEEWPVCPNCTEPMQLFLQLNSDDLPEGAPAPFGDGILQMFYCTNVEGECELDCEAYDPFSRACVVRVVAAGSRARELKESPVRDAFPASTIVDWEECEDFPNDEEIQENGVELPEEESEALSESGFPRAEEKLLGWPYWVQGVEYPGCPTCGTRMRLLFQIDSCVNLPYMFGDAGCGHITQCPEHPQQFAFSWACC